MADTDMCSAHASSQESGKVFEDSTTGIVFAPPDGVQPERDQNVCEEAQHGPFTCRHMHACTHPSFGSQWQSVASPQYRVALPPGGRDGVGWGRRLRANDRAPQEFHVRKFARRLRAHVMKRLKVHMATLFY